MRIRGTSVRGWIPGEPLVQGETGHSAQQTSNTTLRRFTAMRYSYLCLIDCIGGGCCCVSSVNSRSSKVGKVFGSLPECTRLQNYICNISLRNQSEQMYLLARFFFDEWNIDIWWKNYWEIAWKNYDEISCLFEIKIKKSAFTSSLILSNLQIIKRIHIKLSRSKILLGFKNN